MKRARGGKKREAEEGEGETKKMGEVLIAMVQFALVSLLLLFSFIAICLYNDSS